MAKGIIFDIKEFMVHDGPGIRVTVFFKGCPLKCNWCHNPEGLCFKPQLMVRESSCIKCGKCRQACTHDECKPYERCLKACPLGLIKVSGEEVESTELAEKLKSYESFLNMNGGGITISGGEPLAQPEFLLELLKELKPLHTAIETSGFGDPRIFEQTIMLADLILYDIKHMDNEKHKLFTGQDSTLIQNNLKTLIKSNKPFIARIPLIPGVNDTAENIELAAKALVNSPGLIRVELLPYNPFAGSKYKMVGNVYKPVFDEKAEPNYHSDIFEEYKLKYILL